MSYSLFPSMGSNSSGKFPVIIIVFSPIFLANDMVFWFILKINFVCKCPHVCNGCPWGKKMTLNHLESKLQTGGWVLPKVGPGNQIWVISKNFWATLSSPTLQGFCLFLCCFCCLSLCLLPTFWIHFYSLLCFLSMDHNFSPFYIHRNFLFYSEYYKFIV